MSGTSDTHAPVSLRAMVECSECAHRRPVPGSALISCSMPDPLMEGLSFGVDQGWFDYPNEFDPAWKMRLCGNYEAEQ